MGCTTTKLSTYIESTVFEKDTDVYFENVTITPVYVDSKRVIATMTIISAIGKGVYLIDWFVDKRVCRYMIFYESGIYREPKKTLGTLFQNEHKIQRYTHIPKKIKNMGFGPGIVYDLVDTGVIVVLCSHVGTESPKETKELVDIVINPVMSKIRETSESSGSVSNAHI